VVAWKDVPQDAATLVTWRDRYFDVHWHYDSENGDSENGDENGEYVSYGSLALQGTSRIRELAEKYRVDFVITREYPPLGLPVAHTNASYTVYAVSPAAEDSLK
jgi:hypothetical protein